MCQEIANNNHPRPATAGRRFVAEEHDTEPQWIRGVTPTHGELSTHLALDDNRTFAHDPNFPLTLVFNIA